MMLVIGTPNSGKSEMAEKLVMEYMNADENGSYKRASLYVATMIPYKEEGANRVKKHRKRCSRFLVQMYRKLS